MKSFKFSLLKILLGSIAIIGGGSTLAVLATSCGNDGVEKSITGTGPAAPLQVNVSAATSTIIIEGHNGADLKNVTITAPDLGINFGSGTIADGKKTFTITGIPTSPFSGYVVASDEAKGLYCNVPLTIIGAQSISATINGDFQVGESCTGNIVVTGVNGVNLSTITISQFSVNGLVIDNGTIQNDTTKIYSITGTPTSAGNTNIVITGPYANASVMLSVTPAKSLSLSSQTGSFRAGVEASGTFVVTGYYGINLESVSPILFDVPGLTCDEGVISGTTKTFTVTGTPTQSADYPVIFGYGNVTCTTTLDVAAATSISLTVFGEYREGVPCNNCSIVVYGYGAADLSNVTFSNWYVPGCTVDNGTISGTTKTFTVTGTPTSYYIYSVIASNPNDSLRALGFVNVQTPLVVDYNPDGTNWPGRLSGTLSYSLDSDNHTYNVIGSSSNFTADETFTFPSEVVYSGQRYAVKSIGQFAFQADTGLSVVNFNQVTTIEEGAFQNCHLTSVNLSTVQSIGDYAFTGCHIQSIAVSQFNTKYELVGTSTDGFIRRRSDSSIVTPVCGIRGGIACGVLTFPAGTVAIADNAFFDCERITSVNFAVTRTIHTIGQSAFVDCDILQTLNLGQVTTIGNNAFARCNLKSISVDPDNVAFTRVGTAVNGFIKKKSDSANTISAVCGTQGGIACGILVIDTNNTTIGDYAFFGCEGITSINFSTPAIATGLDFIKGCTNLSSVSIVGCYEFRTTWDDGWDGVGPVEGYKTIYASSLTQGNNFNGYIIQYPYSQSWQVVVVQ